jgi:hypothetical protein
MAMSVAGVLRVLCENASRKSQQMAPRSSNGSREASAEGFNMPT